MKTKMSYYIQKHKEKDENKKKFYYIQKHIQVC